MNKLPTNLHLFIYFMSCVCSVSYIQCNAQNNSQHHAQKRQQQEQIKDTTKPKELAEVVVTATRSEKMLSAIPMPFVLISQKQIQQMGSLRLNEVLQEQTGLAIQANHGNGIQNARNEP